jgi:hypothetical protein
MDKVIRQTISERSASAARAEAASATPPPSPRVGESAAVLVAVPSSSPAAAPHAPAPPGPRTIPAEMSANDVIDDMTYDNPMDEGDFDPTVGSALGDWNSWGIGITTVADGQDLSGSNNGEMYIPGLTDEPVVSEIPPADPVYASVPTTDGIPWGTVLSPAPGLTVEQQARVCRQQATADYNRDWNGIVDEVYSCSDNCDARGNPPGCRQLCLEVYNQANSVLHNQYMQNLAACTPLYSLVTPSEPAGPLEPAEMAAAETAANAAATRVTSLCSSSSDCATCTQSGNCGWCTASHSCLPGNQWSPSTGTCPPGDWQPFAASCQ